MKLIWRWKSKTACLSLSDTLLSGGTANKAVSSPMGLAEALDTLYVRACDILDMNLYSFKINIKICRDSRQLKGIYSSLFREKAPDTPSFYSYGLNTIYVSAEDFSRETIGHEIAHAVISNYFVVLPSEKVQEVLAGYVAYQLRNETR